VPVGIEQLAYECRERGPGADGHRARPVRAGDSAPTAVVLLAGSSLPHSMWELGPAPSAMGDQPADSPESVIRRNSGFELNQNARQLIEDLAGKKPQPADAGSQPVSRRRVSVGRPNRGLGAFGVAAKQTAQRSSQNVTAARGCQAIVAGADLPHRSGLIGNGALRGDHGRVPFGDLGHVDARVLQFAAQQDLRLTTVRGEHHPASRWREGVR
jgi:hypothetical protein